MKLVTRSNMQVKDFPGIWRCQYWFPSNAHAGEDVSKYYVRIDSADDGFVLHSLPNEFSAYMQSYFTVDSNLATGMWLENTSPKGEFAGMVYSGVFQVIIADDMKRMTGSWVGIGSKKHVPKIYEGRWEVVYAGQTISELPRL